MDWNGTFQIDGVGTIALPYRRSRIKLKPILVTRDAKEKRCTRKTPQQPDDPASSDEGRKKWRFLKKVCNHTSRSCLLLVEN